MHALLALAVGTAAVGINVGWQPIPGGGLEYIIQIEPEQLATLKRGDELAAEIRPVLSDVRRYRIVIGKGPLPHIGTPEHSVLALPAIIGQPAARLAELEPRSAPATRSGPPIRSIAREPAAGLASSNTAWSSGHEHRSDASRPPSDSVGLPPPPDASYRESTQARAVPNRDPFARASLSGKPSQATMSPAERPHGADRYSDYVPPSVPKTDRYRDYAPLPDAKKEFHLSQSKVDEILGPSPTRAKSFEKLAFSPEKPARLVPDPSVRPVSAEGDESRRQWGTSPMDHEAHGTEKSFVDRYPPAEPAAEHAAKAPVEGTRPWLPLTLTLFALFASLGGNFFLGWISYDARGRFRRSIEQARLGLASK